MGGQRASVVGRRAANARLSADGLRVAGDGFRESGCRFSNFRFILLITNLSVFCKLFLCLLLAELSCVSCLLF